MLKSSFVLDFKFLGCFLNLIPNVRKVPLSDVVNKGWVVYLHICDVTL